MKNNFYANVENEKIFARKLIEKTLSIPFGNAIAVTLRKRREIIKPDRAKASPYKSRNQNFSITEIRHFLSKYRLMVNQRH